MNDQPFTCPYCGARCFQLASFYHTNAKMMIKKCVSFDCTFIGFEMEDKYYLRLWKVN